MPGPEKKKMAKKKKGKAKKGKKEKESKKKKGPSEKDLFELQVEQLKEEFEESEKRLKERRAGWQQALDLLEQQVDRKVSCVAHLKRVARRELEERLAVQDRLQSELDVTELVEKRALGKVAESTRTSDAARSLFLQQKMELEGKLSLMEELRLQRNSQRAQLRRIEATLEEREAALRATGREEDSRQVDKLLRNREKFLRMCASTRAEWRSAFDLRLSVHARRQLEENLRLRRECEGATDRLLLVQELHRTLRARLKDAQLEKEIRVSADRYIASRSDQLEKSIRRLEKEIREMNEAKTEITQELAKERASRATKVRSIHDREIEYCRLLDRSRDVSAVLDDQARYSESLEREIAQTVGRNAAMTSAILGARKTFESRCDSAYEEGTDFEVLRQMRLILDLAETEDSL